MSTFPLFFDPSKERILIVGGGKIALHKARLLLEYSADLTLIAPRFDEEFFDLEGVRLILQEWKAQDLSEYFLVIAATDDPEVNQSVSWCANDQHVLCNVVDNAALSDVIFGSVVHEGDLSIGISTDGASPSAAIHMKKEIRKIIPDHFGEVLDWLKNKRESIIDTFPANQRSEIFHALFDACMSKGGSLDEQEYQHLLESFTRR